jgi:cell division septation protein DedD
VNDEGFREIQLNGKQLVFLFMAATVVSVVIFLCGVLVGRGVRGGASEPAEMTRADLAASSESTTPPESPEPPSTPPAAAPEAPATPPPAAELSYAERLLRDTPPEEPLNAAPAPSSQKSPVSAPAIQEPVAAETPASATPAPAGAQAKPAGAQTTALPPSDPSGPGFAVQVAAYRDKKEADTLAKQLVAKGYPAFVMEPAKGAPMAYFRVRVGKFKTRQDAEAVSAKLQSAEQLTNAWIAR